LYTFKGNNNDKANLALLTKLTQTAFMIEYDDLSAELFYIDENMDKQICPHIEEGGSVSRDWISDKLTIIPFDISQGVNLRRI
jgi:hypothetical protein